MGAVVGALRRALPLLFTARIIALATLPLVVAAIVWLAIAMLAWDPVVARIAHFFGERAGDASGWQRIAAQIATVLMLAALAVATALTAIALLTMPVIVRTVATRHFPRLIARRGGTFVGSARNATVALLVFIPLWVASLVLLVFPPLYAIGSLALNAWFSQRMFRYDALAEHGSADEIATVLRTRKARLFGLGLALSPLSLIPVFNVLVLPIYAGIAFAELCLDELSALRTHAPAGA